MRFQPRDMKILRAVGLMTVTDREQVKIACAFGSTTRVNARLLVLVRLGMLRRFYLGFGAGRKSVYALSEKGARMAEMAVRGPRRRQNETLVADYGVDHQLAINDVYCALAFRPLPVRGIRFRRWLSLHETVSPSLRLIPDGYFELDTPGGILAAFLEVDLGHESLTILKEKARQYLQLAVTSEFSRRFGHSRFRVIVLANSARRLRSIRAAIAPLTEKIFWFATLDAARKEFFANIWLRPAGENPQPFIQEAQ